ncbi:hypothetical protein Lal_00008236, partial [Lupinus albus]
SPCKIDMLDNVNILVLNVNGEFRHQLMQAKINGTHTCVSTSITQDHTKLNSSFIANCIIQLVFEYLDIPIKALVKEVITRFGRLGLLNKIAMFQIYGDWERSYKELPRWLNVVDGRTFLTEKYTGTFLISSSQDGNRHIFPIAFALSKEKLKKSESDFYTMFGHMGTGLLGALRTELPQWCNAKSIYYIRHVASNFNKEFKDTDVLKEKVIEMGMY